MNVCGTCGIVAPRPGLPCEACGARGVTEAPARLGALFFVRARAEFQCRGCGRLAPLDHVDLTGLARCALCGLTQAFDPGAWREGLAFAHGVGDLAGGEGLHPDPRWSIAMANPHRHVGRSSAVETLTLGGTALGAQGIEVQRSLRLAAAPGHPLCGACRSPLQVDVPGEGQIQTRCPDCGATTRYEVPAGVVGACKGLRGVIADLDRAGLREARTVDEAGAQGLSCPGCGAPLKADHSPTAECQFCHLVSRVPTGPRGVHAAPPEPEPMWLVYSGPSQRRRALLQGDGDTPVRAPPEAPTPFWLSMLPSVVLGGGMLVVTGGMLFVLLRMGIVSFQAFVGM